MSRFTWGHLIQLNSQRDAYDSPLAVLSHIDVNAFFAQVEEVRCGYTKDDPVVCVQWNSIIAVSYAARKYGISRMDSIQEALKKSSKIIPIHTAVFRKGEDFWQYHDGCGSWVSDTDKQLPNSLYKVSLDPYRRESRKIFKIFTEYCDLAEKASVDEVFLDLGRLCLQRLIFSDQLVADETNDPEILRIRETFTNGQYQLDSYLPEVPESLKKLKFDGNVYNPNDEPLICDWDDVLLALGSQITQEVRNHIEKTLGYTTSCGVAKTKTVCKLASNYQKPNAQTIILNRCVEVFLDCGNFEITSFWSLGGLLGKKLIEILEAPTTGSIRFVRERWPSSPKELNEYFSKVIRNPKEGPYNGLIDPLKTDVLAEKLFRLVRGDYRSPVTPQTMVKSMMSNKNLNGGSCKSLIDCISWLEVFSGELSSRLHELEQEYSKVVLPRTVSVLVRTKSGASHSKSGPLVKLSSKIDSQCLLKVATKLVTELDSKHAKEAHYYPLQNINMSVSHFEILHQRKSVLDMFPGQTSPSPPSFREESDLANITSNFEPELHTSSDVKFKCQSCHSVFEAERDFQEHQDYHLAMKLSENLNGIDENSENLSIGEKKLLFTKRSASPPPLRQPAPKRSKSKAKTKSSNNILTYFSKR